MRLIPRTRLGPYEILGAIGAGGMGEVYRARDARLDRDVAIKVLPDVVARDPDRLARFEREAKTLAGLNHPNLLAIHDFGTTGSCVYAAMELLEGSTLRERIAGGALPVRKAIDYAAQIASGLAAAHDRGIVHRDLKPENVFVTAHGLVKVLDFGLARQFDPAGAATETRASTDPGTVLGTVGYMSPEQVRADPVDGRSDIFSLGAVLYEMLSGGRAFARDTAAESMTAILKEDPPEIRRAEGELPAAVDAIVRRCLEKSPAERFQSARDLSFALQQALGSGSEGARALAAAQPRARRAGLVALAALALGALAAAGGFAAGRLRGNSAPPVAERRDPAFTRLTFGRGLIRTARFAPDGRTIVYGAAWDGQPLKLFMARADSRASTPLPLPNAELQSISARGEMALTLGHAIYGWIGAGTLARAPLLGGGARQLLADVREADWHRMVRSWRSSAAWTGASGWSSRPDGCCTKRAATSATSGSRRRAIASRSPITRSGVTTSARWPSWT